MASLTFQANACGPTVCQMAGVNIERARETFSIPEPVVIAAVGYPGDPNRLPENLQKKTLAARQRKSAEEFVFENIRGQPAAAIRKRT